MFLRISFRDCDEHIKDTIRKWLTLLSNNNYYNNLYLEDVILTLQSKISIL